MEENEKEKFTLFGKNVEKMPCFKESFTTGIYTGVFASLAHFLFTSRVRRSCDLAIYSFALSTTGYWVYCRYQWSYKQFMRIRMQDAVHKKNVTEGIGRPVDMD